MSKRRLPHVTSVDGDSLRVRKQLFSSPSTLAMWGAVAPLHRERDSCDYDERDDGDWYGHVRRPLHVQSGGNILTADGVRFDSIFPTGGAMAVGTGGVPV